MDKHLTVVAWMTAKPGREDALRELLLGLIAPTRAEAGCVEYYLHENSESAGDFVFYENWVSAEALEQHAAMPYLQNLFTQAPDLVEGEIRVETYWRIA
jgi:quinol monooxygenase YgiN